jgi:hypothetical protein
MPLSALRNSAASMESALAPAKTLAEELTRRLRNENEQHKKEGKSCKNCPEAEHINS